MVERGILIVMAPHGCSPLGVGRGVGGDGGLPKKVPSEREDELPQSAAGGAGCPSALFPYGTILSSIQIFPLY